MYTKNLQSDPAGSGQPLPAAAAFDRFETAWSGAHDRRRGDRRHRLLAILGLLAFFYVSLFVWPTPWRYDRVGRNPLRTNRITGHVEYLNLQGWQPALLATDVSRGMESPAVATPQARPGK